MSFAFTQSINTSPGNHSISMYTIFNCASSSCSSAQDTISVQVQDGSNGFTEVASITGRTQDMQWQNDVVYFSLTENVAHVSR